MLTEKRIGEIAIVMVIKISNQKLERPNPLSTYGQAHAISDAFEISCAEAEKFVNCYAYLNRTLLMQGFDDKQNVTFKSKKERDQEEQERELLGVISIKLLQKKIFREGTKISPSTAKERILFSANEADITILEASQFEAYLFEYFYDQVKEKINDLIIFETGKQIVENIEA